VFTFPFTMFGGTATRTYLNVRNTTTSATSGSWSVNTGQAGLLVIVVEGMIALDNGSISSVTVGGNSATIVAQTRGNSGTNTSAAIVGIAQYASSGGTQTIAVTMQGGLGNYNSIGIDCYVLNGLTSTTATASATGGTGSAATSLSTNISVPSNGIVIANLLQRFNSTLSTTSVTFDQNATTISQGWAVGSDQNLTAQTLTIVNTNAGANSVARATVAAAWN